MNIHPECLMMSGVIMTRSMVTRLNFKVNVAVSCSDVINTAYRTLRLSMLLSPPLSCYLCAWTRTWTSFCIHPTISATYSLLLYITLSPHSASLTNPHSVLTLCLDSYQNPPSDSTQLCLFIMSVILEFPSAFLTFFNVLLIVNFSLSFVIGYGWDVTVGGLVGLDHMRWCFDSWLKFSWLNFNILNIQCNEGPWDTELITASCTCNCQFFSILTFLIYYKVSYGTASIFFEEYIVL